MAQKEKLPTAYLLISAFSLLLLGWLYGGDVSDTLTARTAEVAAFLQPPSLIFAVVVLAAAAAGAVVTIFGLLKRKAGGWRGYRVMPIVTVVVLFVDLFLLSSSHSPLTSADRSLAALQVLTNQANLIGSAEGVPKLSDLQTLIEPFEAPAYLVKGERPKDWVLEERRNCTGPVTEAGGKRVGTIFYCVSADGRSAWLSLVALPVEQRFGTAQVMKRAGQVVSGQVLASKPDDGTDDGSGDEVEVPPMPFPQVNDDAFDGGF